MKRVCVSLMVLGLLLAIAPGAVEAKKSGDKCSLEGTWYGSNTLDADYVLTIARTGSKSYSAWLVSGSGPAHGEFVRKAGGKFKTTWMGYGNGPEFGYPAGTKVMYYMKGTGRMKGCNRWTATLDWHIYLFNEGLQEDPFVDGVYQTTLPGIELTYKRMPMDFAAP